MKPERNGGFNSCSRDHSSQGRNMNGDPGVIGEVLSYPVAIGKPG